MIDLEQVENVIFDLDGTIIDPLIGITKSIQYAMQKLGKEPLPTEDLLFCIGPPLYETFPKLFGRSDKEFIYHAVDVYREYYREKGIYEHELYNGIVNTLTLLKNENKKLFIATSKPRVMAEKIAEFREIADLFTSIHGCELDGTRSNKIELLRYLLQKEKLIPGKSIMIGDRSYDILGGVNNNMLTCGVLYGYGSEDELKNAGADFIITGPEELITSN